jgi:type IV pilus assembly protein PilC
MAKSAYFLPMMVQMVSVGETTGNLDTTLLATAQNYETEVEDRMDALVASIEPTLTVVIGAVVALIALSMITAMYSVYGKVL